MPDQFAASSRAKTDEDGITMPAAYIPEESDDSKQDNHCVYVWAISWTRASPAYVMPCTCTVNNETPVGEHANQRTHQRNSIAIYLIQAAQLNMDDIAREWNSIFDVESPNCHGQRSPPSNNYANLSYLPTGNASITDPSRSPFHLPHLLQEPSIRKNAGRAQITLLKASLTPHSTPRDQKRDCDRCDLEWPPSNPIATLTPVDRTASIKSLDASFFSGRVYMSTHGVLASIAP
ncbi:hypothetical protein EW146_g1968 [Bondarzewia mesenterica]|uniref:Uncharacterized protein n=1 Tax=Bondarzewia mesenterica TaxID=1095465 RepID=A0A4S4M8D3_9AGAM|nr:hypothetical protein EW146_g1968 [Bondarzewia mesenterica]